MATLADVRHKPSTDRCELVKGDLIRAIEVICVRWPEAAAAHEASAYGSGSEVSPIGSGGVSDPTGNRAARGSPADAWIRAARPILVWMLDSTSSGWRSNGAFKPSVMAETFKRAAAELVELWPLGIGRVFDRLLLLADQALAEWPATPKAGEVVDGVKIGSRLETLETCVECRQPVAGGAADPIRRIDGQPFHAKPCYMTVYMRAYRARVNIDGVRKQSA